MSNLDKAIEVLDRLDNEFDYSEGPWPGNETVVKALADAGLLAPELPEPYMSKFDTSAVFVRDEDSADGAYIDVKVETGSHRRGRITIDLDPSSRSDHGFTLIRSYVSPQWCRESAALLLAAANYAEEANQ